MVFRTVGQPGKPWGLTWPGTLCVAQPATLRAADSGTAVTPTPHRSAALSIHPGRLNAVLGMH